ncbi:LOW QUALITY PROTEIN: tyrosine-protein kinase hopscotch-like [Drosophila tropicalis]|uniref:LOW QUALITY PROTEIN: tyrosine-protein kinase hopscotch-like n=1 Tax=Drosophila tropicalis TaxID=46794 RepID=UPI0035AB8CA3
MRDMTTSGSDPNQDRNSGAFTQQEVGITSSPNDGKITVYIYTSEKPMKFATTLNCEEVCTEICRELKIKPLVQLIYGICERPDLSSKPKPKTKSKSNKNASLNRIGFWPLPGECLDSKLSYCFRIRFRIPEMERQLQRLDPVSYDYLYYQMRHDMVHEQISEIRYSDHKDMILGLVVLDMLIDLQIVLERDKAAKELGINSDSRAMAIVNAYKSYLPRSIRKNHGIFTYFPLRKSFRKIKEKQFTLDQHKFHYISSICSLAPNYMIMDEYMVSVDAFPNEVESGNTPLSTSSNSIPDTNEPLKVLVRLWTHASTDHGLKIARISAKPRWILVAITENIDRATVTDTKLSLEISGMVDDFIMTFETIKEMKSFLSYLNTYKRLTGLWLKDICTQYSTPSLKDIKETAIHGPIGGISSLRKLNDYHCGSYIIRQCDQEYFTYYIDINIKRENSSDMHRRFDTKIFKIEQAGSQWGRIESPQFLKLYGLTQLSPFTMVMEYAKYGPFDQFLKSYPNVGISSLKLVLRDLTRGIDYLEDNDIKHNYIRCSNLFITGFKAPYISVKIGDPGYPRRYNETDFAWIPMKFYNNPEQAKSDSKTQYWAFATTTYEIFSRCREDLSKFLKETFLQNYTNAGFILPTTDEEHFPSEISHIIMDGWSDENNFNHDGYNVPVAIKRLYERCTSKDFQNEIHIMHSLRHPNVVELKHWSATYIIMEFLDCSLDQYLKTNLNLSRKQLEYFSLDIARGMEYLAEKRIVHRDLAARNVLVKKSRNIVKISDFGLSKKLNDEGIYVGVTSRPRLPIAWFSPEAFEHKKFSMYSDIWSYGVTLYEIFTRGSVPPLIIRTNLLPEIAAYLKQKERFPRPQPLEACADFVYNDIMLKCWNEEPTDRPTFTMIIDILIKNIETSNTMNQSQQQDQPTEQPQQNHPKERHQQLQQQNNGNNIGSNGYTKMNVIIN